jgi:hypothetical protein
MVTAGRPLVAALRVADVAEQQWLAGCATRQGARVERGFPFGQRAQECTRVPASVPARQARPIGCAGAVGERVVAQTQSKKVGEKDERERVTRGVHRSAIQGQMAR